LIAVSLVLLTLFNSHLTPLQAQGTAFTYQGRLDAAGSPANGIYDLQFALFDAASGGTQQSGTLTQLTQGVTNGLFTVELDFGSNFPGASRWLQIGVRTNGGSSFTTLTPRQKFAATPYAITAGNFSGSITAAQLPAGVVTNSASGVNLTGNFSGNGANVTNVNAATLGGLSSAGFWRTNGNAGANPTNGAFLGTTDNQALEIRVNNVRGLRIEPDPRPGNNSANLIGGNPSNLIEFPGSGGSAIVGGGFLDGGNVIRSNSSGVFIGAGSINEVGPNANDVVIAGGYGNIVRSALGVIGGGAYNQVQTNTDYAMIGGGYANSIQSDSVFSAILGGYNNRIQTNSGFSAIGGGQQNEIQSYASYATIGGGVQNTIQSNAFHTTIGGGANNNIQSNAWRGTVGGGAANTVGAPEGTVAGGAFNSALAFSATIGGGGGNAASGEWSTIAGGRDNLLTNAHYATIGGGVGNTNTGYAATVAGGFFNTAANNGAAVGGGGNNSAFGFNSVVAGGNNNLAVAEDAVIGGGHQNTNTGNAATISGGFWNQALDFSATVPGGYWNLASGAYSLAAGRQAKAIHQGAFVWADSIAADFASAANNEFAVRASGGVRFSTSGAGFTLNGQQVLTANAITALTLNNPANLFVGNFTGNGAGLTNLGAWRLGGNTGTTAGANFVGTTDNQPLEFKVNNARALRLEPTAGTPNVIGGDTANAVTAGVIGATIGGGSQNTNSGSYATIPGGAANRTGGDYAFAAGRQAKANHAGAFVWADNQAVDFASSGANQFLVRAGGGVGINTNNPGGAALAVNGNIATSGSLLFSDPTKSITFPVVPGANTAMINMFADGTANATRMVIAHSPNFQNYGLRYIDTTDQFEFIGAVSSVMNIGLGSGHVGIGTNNPTAALHVGGTPGTDGIRFPDGTLQTTAPVPVFASGPGLSPTTTNQFLAATATVTVNSANQRILVTSHKALGSGVVGGANGLNLFIGYRSAGTTVSPTPVGNGTFGNQVPQGTRVTMGLSAVVTGLAPGNYEVGLMGNSAGAANWNNNEFSYTTATVY